MSPRETPRPRITPQLPATTVSLSAIVWFLRRNLLLVVGPGLILAAAAGLFLLFVDEPVYEASATLVVAPPAIASDLVPATFSATEYAKLLESDSLVAEVRQHLQDSKDWSPDQTADIEDTLKVSIHSPNRKDSTNSIALIEITTEGRSPKAAADLANTWSNVLVTTSKKVTWGTTSSAIDLIEEHFPQSEDRLASLEDKKLEVENGYEKRRTALADSWEERLTSSRKRHEEQITAHQDETRELFRKIGESRGLWSGTQTPGTAASGPSAPDPSTEVLAPAVRGKLSSLLVARRQLAQTLPFRTLKRSVSADALTEALGDRQANPGDFDSSLGDGVAVTDQEVNPLHSELELTASRIEMDLEGETTAESSPVREVVGELASLQRARSASLAQLLTEQDAELKALERQRQAELSVLQRERETAVEKLDRQIQTETGLFSELAKHHNEAALLVAQKDLDPVHLATTATEPAAPIPPHVAFKSSLAGLIGLLLGLTVATLREIGAG